MQILQVAPAQFGWTLSLAHYDDDFVSVTYRSPVTVGTIFAIQRKFFFEVGAFDDEMQGWGGENLDLPIRVSTKLPWVF